MSDVVEANDRWVLATLKIDPVVLRTLPNGGAPELTPEPSMAATSMPGIVSSGEPVASNGSVTQGTASGSGLQGKAVGTVGTNNLGLGTGFVSGGEGTSFGQGSGTEAGGSNAIWRGTADQGREQPGADPVASNGSVAQGATSTKSEPATVESSARGSDTRRGTEGGLLINDLGLGTGSVSGGQGTVFGQGSGTEAGGSNIVLPSTPDQGSNRLGTDLSGNLMAGGNTGSDSTETGTFEFPTVQPANVPKPPSTAALEQAMLDKMPLSTKRPDWAKGIDMTQAKLGKEIKSGSFGTTAWLSGVGGESLVIKTSIVVSMPE